MGVPPDGRLSWLSAVLCVAVLAAHPVAAADSHLHVLDTLTGDEETVALWTAMVRELRNDSGYVLPANDPTAAQRAWSSLIASRVERWQSEISGLVALFVPAAPPASVRIVIGNGGGEDAFTHDANTIGFDAARLHAEYGDTNSAENVARIDRFFRHEYVHLLQKSWLVRHPYAADTPLRAALLGMWTEGLGNYYSLSSRWRDTDGALTTSARQTLTRLTPRLLARLAALACASPERGPSLMTGLSMGPFTEKWGALPVALWLAEDEHASTNALRAFVVAGPEGVWTLSSRYLPEESRALLQEIQAAAALCAAK